MSEKLSVASLNGETLYPDEYSSLRSYDRLAQLDFAAFQNLACTISNYALRKIEAEWVEMQQAIDEIEGTD